jgi:FtsP/CotA-like multicopper oxidase with cupredoxin domain
VRITVVNHLGEPTTIHWHGIELESYPDGVPGWSGSADRIFQSIAPADSFDADFTPPRAGTFIYHSHFHETRQLGLGLYGPLIVLEPGRHFDPETDRIVVVGLAGTSESNVADTASSLINGRVVPAPIELRAGTRYRVRLINIDPDHRIVFALVRDSVPLSWRPIARDGADLPPALAVMQPAHLMTGPGQTADFEITPRERGDFTLSITAPYASRPWTIDDPVHVR